jgi:hypothetical protein
MKTCSTAFAIILLANAAHAADKFPTKGIFTEAESESDLDFGKREMGFPDEVCTFSKPRRLSAGKWRISLKCNQADGPDNQIETATLQRKGKGWRVIRKDGARMFTLDFKP